MYRKRMAVGTNVADGAGPSIALLETSNRSR